MKKSVIIAIAVAVVIAIVGVIFFMSRGNGGNAENNSKPKGTVVDLKLDFKHMNNTVYSAKISISEDDKVIEQKADEPNFVRIENTKDNYGLDLTLDTEAKEGYEQLKNSAKEKNNTFKEVKFGKYDGYYSDSVDGLYGYVLLDESDATFNAFIMFNLYVNDQRENETNLENVYKTKIQNILNSIEFNTSK